MTTTNSFFRKEQQITSVRLARNSNLAGTYDNGDSHNGIGATLTVAASSLTIDSVACEVGDRVILFGQTNGYENGIYIINSISSTVVLERTPDFQMFSQMKPGYYIPISAGSEYKGSVFIVVEPQAMVIGTDTITFANSASTPDSITLANNGLKIYDTNSSHILQITPGSNLTADRVFTLTTGDAARTLDISAASVTVSAFGATLVDDASKLVALTTLGIKRGTTDAYAGGGTSNAFVATGIAATDIVVASMLTASNAVAIKAVFPTVDVLTVEFTANPGANTVINWIAIATV